MPFHPERIQGEIAAGAISKLLNSGQCIAAIIGLPDSKCKM